jgi:hypothetical protein
LRVTICSYTQVDFAGRGVFFVVGCHGENGIRGGLSDMGKGVGGEREGVGGEVGGK